MKKFIMLILSGVSIIVLSGCGGGGGDDYSPAPVTYYLQTFDVVDDIYRGVSGIEYDCGPDSGVTGANGSFVLYEGDMCIFYGLDETLSLSINEDELYMDSALINIDYSCDSGFSGTTSADLDGMFIFDPYWTPEDIKLPLGDICTFQF